MKSTFRILFLLRTSQLSKDGLATLMIRITISGSIVEFSSKLRIKPSLWNNGARRVNGKSKYATDMNHTIDTIRARLLNSYLELFDKDGIVTPRKLRNYFLGIEESKYSLLSLFNKKITQKGRLINTAISKETYGKYVCTRDKIKSFLKSYYKVEDITMRDVNYDFIVNYEIYLRSEGKCGHNTTVRHLRYLKQVTSDAIKCKYISFDPFNEIRLTSQKGNREYLTLTELINIASKEMQSETLKEMRDIFIFSCFTGLAFIDLNSLKYSDIYVNENGKRYISKNRSKTGVKAYIPLLDIPELILEKYKNRILTNERILPVTPCQSMNRYIKEITAYCGINKKISTHCGRHTFATLMLTKGVPIESISKMLGHTDISTTQIYARILNVKVDEDMTKVQNQFDELKRYFL